MSGHSYTPPIPGLTLLFSILGLAWCAYISFPAADPAPCATSGCELFRDGKIAGLSLWWVGGAFFFVLSVLCLRGKSFLAARLLVLGIFLDALLLIVMFFTAPCFDCLVFAAFLGLCLLSLLLSPSAGVPFRRGSMLLLAVWFGLFLANSVLAANEQVPHYTLGHAEAKDIRLYFSPSCPACREAVKSLGGKAVLYPIEEQESDFEAILRFGAYLQDESLSYEQALRKSLDPLNPIPETPLLRRLELRLQLLRNKAVVFRQGFRALPLIEINGMPGFNPLAEAGPEIKTPGRQPSLRMSGHNPQAGHEGTIELTPDFLDNMEELGQCNRGSQAPCD